mmetsp:Transcript_38682/g.38228  ORF Transcript_38682/g.38228 Transcript_38682/m.38228 type:complete len:139 (+) Transcript_38682:1090-1506(+)
MVYYKIRQDQTILELHPEQAEQDAEGDDEDGEDSLPELVDAPVDSPAEEINKEHNDDEEHDYDKESEPKDSEGEWIVVDADKHDTKPEDIQQHHDGTHEPASNGEQHQIDQTDQQPYTNNTEHPHQDTEDADLMADVD